MGVPSSLIFAGLVATWLAVLVPMAARRRQPMSRPTDAALSCRVLERPARRNQEVSTMGRTDVDPSPHTMPDTSTPAEPEVTGGYRPGRGGYDAEGAALAARARYAFRQRMVLGLVLIAVASGLVAGGLALPKAWWVHACVDLLLIGYLMYLRRQVRIEQDIRARRAARMAGSRRSARAGSGRPGTVTVAEEAARLRRDAGARRESGGIRKADDCSGSHEQADVYTDDGIDGIDDGIDGIDDEDPTAERDVEAPDEPDAEDDTPALPQLRPVPPPPRPAGTVVLELDDEDPELHDLDAAQPWGHRRASGQ